MTKKQMKRVAGMLRKDPELARAVLAPLAAAHGYTGNQEAELAFMSVLDTFGDRWKNELHILSVVNNNLPRILILAPRETPDEQCPWTHVHVEAGFLSQEAVTADQFKDAVRAVLTAHAPETGVAVWLSASNAAHDPRSPGHFAYMVHANGTEAGALFQRSGYERNPVDKRWWTWIETLLSGMGKNLCGEVLLEAQRLRESPNICEAVASAKSAEAQVLMEQLLSDESLFPYLSRIHRTGFDTVAEAVTDLLCQSSITLEKAVARLMSAQTKALAEQDDAHAEELERRQRHAQSDKASTERITEGLRARLARLEDELKTLRKQAKARPAKGPHNEPADDPLGAALDRMFA